MSGKIVTLRGAHAEGRRSGQARIRWVSGKIAALRGAQAEVKIRQDAARIMVPLYSLRFDASAPVELPTYTEPMWLLDLAHELLAGENHGSLPDRGAVARAVKQWLEAIRERGIAAFGDGSERPQMPQDEVHLQLEPAVDGLVSDAFNEPEDADGDDLEYLCGCDRRRQERSGTSRRA